MNRDTDPRGGPPPIHATEAATAKRRERGQTSIDFAIGMGIFLVAITTVIAFMPSIIQPFTGGQQNPLSADRLVMQVTNDQLAESSGTVVLNGTCTMYFFNETDDPADLPDPCDTFDADDDLYEKIGVEDTRFVNVTLQANVSDHNGGQPEVLCTNTDGQIVGHEDPDDASSCGGTHLAVGSEPPTGGASITVARRKALLPDTRIWQITVDRKTVFIVVKVWT